MPGSALRDDTVLHAVTLIRGSRSNERLCPLSSLFCRASASSIFDTLLVHVRLQLLKLAAYKKTKRVREQARQTAYTLVETSWSLSALLIVLQHHKSGHAETQACVRVPDH